MLQGVIMKLILGFIAHELSVAEASIDWAKLEAELEVGLKKILPSFMEDEAVVLMKKAVEAVKAIVGGEGVIAKVVELVAAKDFVGVLEYLKGLVLAQVQPGVAAESVSYEQLAEAIKAV